MKINQISILILLLLSFTFITSCNDDDPDDPLEPMPTGNTVTYELSERAVDGINGTVTFIENDDASTTVEISLNNTPAGGEHPAHIHANTAAEGGPIVITLGTVDGDTGESSITFSTSDDGTPITYTQLLDFDGHVNVHLSSSELSTIVAQGDIGQNDLNGTIKEYDLNSVAVPEISGNIVFAERENGEILATISLMNTPEDGTHPAHIHANSAADGGGIILSFNPVDGATGISRTNITQFDDGTPITFDELLELDAHVNVHLSESELGTIVAQTDIGENEFTGEEISYDLATRDVEGISGVATFAERMNGSTLVTIGLTGTPDGGEHPAHIHQNSAEAGGGIVISLEAVDGTTGISQTDIEVTDNEETISYEDLLIFDGHINVHLSPDDLTTIVAQGNIGVNAE
ncbi:MAG: CHRD domain-containing protein [Cyclobacteriaceae bacterium]